MSRTQHGPSRPMSSVSGDLERVRGGAAATAAELREFMATLRGRSPQEVLGAVAQSGLAQGILQSTLATLAILAVFTVIPFLQSQYTATAAPTEAAAPAAAATAPAATPAMVPVAPAPLPPGAPPTAGQALDVMGENDVKLSDPDQNPLDKLDNLLDGDQ